MSSARPPPPWRGCGRRWRDGRISSSSIWDCPIWTAPSCCGCSGRCRPCPSSSPPPATRTTAWCRRWTPVPTTTCWSLSGPTSWRRGSEAVLRRAADPADAGRARLAVGPLVVEPHSRRVAYAGQPVELSPKEFDLLAYLAARAGTVVSKRELLSEVWQLPYGGSDKTVDVHLSWLRRKLGESGAAPRLLQTVRGVGVRLAEPEP